MIPYSPAFKGRPALHHDRREISERVVIREMYSDANEEHFHFTLLLDINPGTNGTVLHDLCKREDQNM